MPRSQRRAIRATLVVLAVALSTLAVAYQASPALAADTASIKGSTTFQAMAGFGFAEAFGVDLLLELFLGSGSAPDLI